MAATAIFHTVGRRLFNQVFTGATTRPTALWLGLRQLDGVGGHPSDAAAADTMTSNLQEVTPTNTGYARVSISLNGTNMPESLSGIDSILTFAVQAFNFSGSALPVNGITHAFICTGSTATDTAGVLIASAPLAATRNVAAGDQINETFTFSLAGTGG